MNDHIAQVEGWWWPASDTDARYVIMADYRNAIAAILPHIEGRIHIVQAGANVGVYPITLTDHFATVTTFEPDPTNWACLVNNLKARDGLERVGAFNAALGEHRGVCATLEVHARNCGANRVAFDTGAVPVRTIDGLDLGACDAIWLDIEGSELFALRGAVNTIERFSPTIAVEDKGLDGQFFGVPPGSLQTFLADLGYQEVARIGNDKVFRRLS